MRALIHWFALAVAAFSFSVIISTAINGRAYAQAAATVASQTASPSATAPAVVPSPVEDPGLFASVVRDAWRDGSYLTVALLMLYGGLIVARRYVAWLGAGRRAAIVAAGLTALAAAIAALSDGQTPTAKALVAALSAGVALYLRPDLKEARDD